MSQVVGQTPGYSTGIWTDGYVTGSWIDGLFHRQLDRRVIPQAVGQTGYSTGSWTDGLCHRQEEARSQWVTKELKTSTF